MIDYFAPKEEYIDLEFGFLFSPQNVQCVMIVLDRSAPCM